MTSPRLTALDYALLAAFAVLVALAVARTLRDAKEGRVTPSIFGAGGTAAMNLGDEKRALAKASPGKLIRWYSGSWEFLLSVGAKCPVWMFSAMLYPRGRSSTLQDWTLLGQTAAAVGAPAEPSMGNTVETAPNAVHKWAWMEGETSGAASTPAPKVERKGD